MVPFTREQEFVLRAGPLQLFPDGDSSNGAMESDSTLAKPNDILHRECN